MIYDDFDSDRYQHNNDTAFYNQSTMTYGYSGFSSAAAAHEFITRWNAAGFFRPASM